MTMPNFIIIGSAKAGTSSVYHYLSQHPEIYMSPLKETEFFIRVGQELEINEVQANEVLNKGVGNLEDYRALFQGVKNEIAIGEATPGYLYHSWVPKTIQQYIPDAKLIVLLRDPVERAYSHFWHNVGNGRETLDFAGAIQHEKVRMNEKWGIGYYYVNRGFYYPQLKRFFDVFDPKQIKVCLFEDLIHNPTDTVQDIFRFLGVNDTYIPENISEKYLAFSRGKNKYIDKLLEGLNPIKSILKTFVPKQLGKSIINSLTTKDKPTFPAEIRRELVQGYREDIFKLQGLIDRDLSKWLKE
jgi:hypothetical protein